MATAKRGTFIIATISSGSLTFTTSEAFTTGEANDFHLVYDPDSTKMIIGLRLQIPHKMEWQ